MKLKLKGARNHPVVGRRVDDDAMRKLLLFVYQQVDLNLLALWQCCVGS